MCSAKWSNKFLSHLEDEVLAKLNELREFMHSTRAGLERETAPGDTNTLMAVMGNIRDVRQRMDTTIEMLEARIIQAGLGSWTQLLRYYVAEHYGDQLEHLQETRWKDVRPRAQR